MIGLLSGLWVDGLRAGRAHLRHDPRDPVRADQKEFNLRVWELLLADPERARIPGRFETDRHGRIILTPPPSYQLGGRRFEIGFQLRSRPGGNVRTECPLSTSDGVMGIDGVWLSDLREAVVVSGQLLVEAPGICVEVMSPSNTRAEMEEKRALHFDAGADEVWFCREDGSMEFPGASGPLGRSLLCPEFPEIIEA